MWMRRTCGAVLPCIAATVLACGGPTPGREDARAEEAPVIAGDWLRHGRDGWPLRMWATADQMSFDTEVDSIYWYRYRRRGSVLDLEHDDGRRSEGRVLKLTPDSLVLDGVPLPGVTGPVRLGRR